MLAYGGGGPIPTMYGGTWKQVQTVSPVHFNCSISCESTAFTAMPSYVSPSPSTATFPTLSPVKFVSQYAFSRCAVSSLMAPGAVRTPPGLLPDEKNFCELLWMLNPCK